MEIPDDFSKVAPFQPSTFAHKLVTVLTRGPSAYALFGLTAVATVSVAFLKASLVLSIYMIGVALVTMYSIMTISLQDQDASYFTAEKSLPTSEEPSPNSFSSDIAGQTPQPQTVDLVGAAELEVSNTTNVSAHVIQPKVVPVITTNPPAHVIQPKVVPVITTNPPAHVIQPKVMPVIDEAICKTNNPPVVQVRTFRTNDSVQCELRAATAVIDKANYTVRAENATQEHKALNHSSPDNVVVSPAVKSATNKDSVESKSDAEIEGAKIPALLPQNVLKTTATHSLLGAKVPVVAKPSSDRILQKKTFKKLAKTFNGEGVISFLYHSKMWGRIRLSAPTKWGENQVFFHRSHLSGDSAVNLSRGQAVKVEYLFRRRNKGKADCLRACRVQLAGTTAERPTKWRAREPTSWRSRSMLRRPTSLRAPSMHRSARVAKGPSANGDRGFHFRRSAVC